jgi:hypothetical protein
MTDTSHEVMESGALSGMSTRPESSVGSIGSHAHVSGKYWRVMEGLVGIV